MYASEAMLKIRTLGCFSMSVAGNTVGAHWPDEMEKEFFCTLLSPLDLTFTWDRLCRSLWSEPATPDIRRRLEETILRPLNGFFINELGFNPLITGVEGIRLDPQRTQVDALEFYNSIRETLNQFSLTNHAAALDSFKKASSLYAGSYLPGIPGTIIVSTRNQLETLYQLAFSNAMPLLRNSSCSDSDR